MNCKWVEITLKKQNVLSSEGCDLIDRFSAHFLSMRKKLYKVQ
jgi:hypothetical protein